MAKKGSNAHSYRVRLGLGDRRYRLRLGLEKGTTDVACARASAHEVIAYLAALAGDMAYNGAAFVIFSLLVLLHPVAVLSDPNLVTFV